MEASKAVAIGASAGALEALSIVFRNLPADYPLPILVVVHVPPDKKSVMAEVVRAKCRMQVREAEDKEPLEAGTVYLAPPDYHMLVEADKYISLSNEEAVMYSRPSIDVLFESAADAYGENMLGVVLTGANADGARGLRAIEEAGGGALVQEPQGAFASAMPLAALNACKNARRLSLEDISIELLNFAGIQA
jgi:two-component system chemotaxis response regulator CheB